MKSTNIFFSSAIISAKYSDGLLTPSKVKNSSFIKCSNLGRRVGEEGL
jgi:hypothetical protein